MLQCKQEMAESVDSEVNKRVKELEKDLAELRGRCVNGTLKGQLPEGFLEQFKDLRAELLCKIFSYLDRKDIPKLRAVCRTWDELIVRTCYRHLEESREDEEVGEVPGRIHIDVRNGDDGGFIYGLFAPERRQYKDVDVKVDSLRFCIMPFCCHEVALSIGGMKLDRTPHAFSEIIDALGDKVTLDIWKVSIDCSLWTSQSTSFMLQKLLTSPHCRNIEEFELDSIDLRGLSKPLDEVLQSLPTSLKEFSATFEYPDVNITDDGLCSLIHKKGIRNITLENCSSITPEGVVRAVEELFTQKLSNEFGANFRSSDVVKLKFQKCEKIQKDEMKSLRRPIGDVDDGLPFRNQKDALVLTYKSVISRLPVNVYVTNECGKYSRSDFDLHPCGTNNTKNP